jgi:hypothetical protein
VKALATLRNLAGCQPFGLFGGGARAPLFCC